MRFKKMQNEGKKHYKPGLHTRNVQVDGRRTSVRLEPFMWHCYDEMVQRQRIRQQELMTEVKALSDEHKLNFTAALRSYITRYYYDATSEEGHMAAGHGTLPRQKQNI